MIRYFTPEDRQALISLLRLNIPQYFAPSEEQDFSEYLDTYLESYFVVEEAGKIIGCGGINYFLEEKIARLSWDIIHPDFQGKGIGRTLTQYRINQIRKNADIRKIVVRTTQLVYPFYQKMGFILEKSEKDYWAKGFDLYQMRLDINKQISYLSR
ncbi:GNAT family N-acetyltransferase [Rhodocytophaga rosea]|uniref:GNAT family N-acetyltransferase n=1 Tax=Rhodocytophaga rosea TaxID=2704465 RepID=A0A6C0GRP0_9BACT|nr:GNAT family N-acetyltransferase [Rhodocytophaga rosea]QHT70729.1 GNAT family N-acetyltransferase [Rhodocytophaga rosea]